MSKELQIGKINEQELADWFNTSVANLKHHWNYKINSLNKYCKFQELPEHIIEILEIYKPVYTGNNKYQIGDKIGPYQTELLERVKSKDGKHSFGKFKCSFCGTEFITRIDLIVKGSTKACGCQLKEYYLNHRVDLTGQRFGKLTAIKDVGSKYNCRLWLCQCDCGRTTTLESHNWKNISSCGRCKYSKGEQKIEQLLTEHNIAFEQQKVFDTCKNETYLRFDFFLQDYNLLIEYDGQQHFYHDNNNGWNTKENFGKTQMRDAIKNQWCKDNNIPLIRIPYTHFEEICIEDLLPNSSFII